LTRIQPDSVIFTPLVDMPK